MNEVGVRSKRSGLPNPLDVRGFLAMSDSGLIMEVSDYRLRILFRSSEPQEMDDALSGVGLPSVEAIRETFRGSDLSESVYGGMLLSVNVSLDETQWLYHLVAEGGAETLEDIDVMKT